MDIDLARTFLEVVRGGSFVAAADRLHLTQTAVSARIRALEDQLGRRLFVRNKAGARLTPAGERFQPDAIALMQLWERACQRVALPPGRADAVGVGGEPSLWSPLLADLLIWMRRECPEIAFRAEVDTPGRLLRSVRDGSLDLAVLYGPPPQPDLAVELLAEERLVMVTTHATGALDPDAYVHVDWGPAFTASQRAAFPDLANPAVSISLGPLALAYLLAVGGTGYFRSKAVAPHLADGRLRRVAQAPEFSHSVHAVYSTRSEAGLVDRVRVGLRACAA
ncbi:MAG: LysR family transcriptional regulator [Alphaproteobacteria bacterium]|nr:LysR family transcriptional regulator [Alphaproteobacteria bacterium]